MPRAVVRSGAVASRTSRFLRHEPCPGVRVWGARTCEYSVRVADCLGSEVCGKAGPIFCESMARASLGGAYHPAEALQPRHHLDALDERPYLHATPRKRA